MDGCVFCGIVRGEVPATIMYEDAATLGIVPLGQVVEGHTLVIPKAHFEGLLDVDEPTLAAVSFAAKRIAARLVERMEAMGVNLLHASGADAQQSVFHLYLHFHVVPRRPGDGRDLLIRERTQVEGRVRGRVSAVE